MRGKVKKLWLVMMLVVLALLTVGCKQQPTPPPVPPPLEVPPVEGPRWFPGTDPNFRQLTDSEKEKVIEIALKNPRISEWLQRRTDFRVEGIQWYAIIWADSEPGTWWALDYEEILAKGVPSFVSKSTRLYPGVTIAVGEGTITQAQIAVDLETDKAVMVDGPYPSLDSLDRFKSPAPPK